MTSWGPSRCVLMLYAWLLFTGFPSLPRKLQNQPSKVPLALMCALLLKGVAVPLRACVMLLQSCREFLGSIPSEQLEYAEVPF